MPDSYLKHLSNHLLEITDTLADGGKVVAPPRLGQPVETGLVVQAEVTKLRHIIQHLNKLDEVKGEHQRVKEIDIWAIVGRFLAWRLPHDFNPDGGIRFDGSKDGPVGTNLFSATQAEQMVRHILADVLERKRDDEPVSRHAEASHGVKIDYQIGDKVVLDHDIVATVSEILIYGVGATRYRCEYVDRGENRAPWVQPERLRLAKSPDA